MHSKSTWLKHVRGHSALAVILSVYSLLSHMLQVNRGQYILSLNLPERGTRSTCAGCDGLCREGSCLRVNDSSFD